MADRQLDIFGKPQRRPGGRPGTWQPSLVSRDMEREADGEELRAALGRFAGGDTTSEGASGEDHNAGDDAGAKADGGE